MLDSWRRRAGSLLPKGKVGRSVVTLASGTAAAQVIMACAMPIVTRLYSPEQIGVISLFLSFFGLWASTLSLRYEYALLVAQDDVESHIVYRVATICVCLTSILAVPVLFGLHHSGMLGFGLLPWWSALAAMPLLLGYGQFMVLRSWALRAGMIKQIAIASMARSAANVVTRIALGLVGFGVPGLFVAELAKAWSSFGTLSRAVRMHFASSRPPQITMPALRGVMRRYVKFPAFEMPSTLLDSLGMALPVPMIAALFGATAAGWFGLARMLVALPNAQIGGAVADVFQKELALAVRNGQQERARSLFFRLLRKLCTYGLIPMVAAMTLGPWLAALVFGQAWQEMGVIAACIAPWLYAGLVVSSLSRLVSVLQVQQFKLAYDITATLLVFVAFAATKRFEWGLYGFIVGISAANVVAYAVFLLVMLWIVRVRLPAAVAS